MPTRFDHAFRISVNGTALAPETARHVLDLTVIQELGTLEAFSFTLANPYPELRWTHTADADLFSPGSEVKIEMGYVDDLHVLLDGDVTCLSPRFPESAAPALEVCGHSRLHRLMGDRKTRSFHDMTDKQIVEQLASGAGLRADAEDTKTKHPFLLQSNQTDLEFLLARAQAIRFEVRVEDGALKFRQAQEDQGKVATLEYGRDLKHFEPTLRLRKQASKVTVRGWDPVEKKEIVGQAAAGDEDSTMGGAETAASLAEAAFGAREEVQVNRAVASKEEADQLARAIFNQRLREAWQGTGSSIGRPDLQAGRVIEVKGVGTLFSGLYYITRATHKINSAGYETAFAVERPAGK